MHIASVQKGRLRSHIQYVHNSCCILSFPFRNEAGPRLNHANPTGSASFTERVSRLFGGVVLQSVAPLLETSVDFPYGHAPIHPILSVRACEPIRHSKYRTHLSFCDVGMFQLPLVAEQICRATRGTELPIGTSCMCSHQALPGVNISMGTLWTSFV